MTVLVLVLVCVVPTLIFCFFARVFDWVTQGEPFRRRRRTPAPDPKAELPELGADLRRLSAELRWLMQADVPGRALRLRALELAYDDTLLRVGAVLELELPPPPLGATSRLDAEVELATHGFTW